MKEIGSKKKIYAYKKEIKGEKGIQHHRETLNIRQAVKHWDDLHPNLYRLEICITQKGQSQLKTVDFGFRNVTASRSKILINNRPVFMRGNLDCLHFPLTGYPSCDIQEWERIFRLLDRNPSAASIRHREALEELLSVRRSKKTDKKK